MNRNTVTLMACIVVAVLFALFLVAFSFGMYALGVPAPVASILMIGMAIVAAHLMKGLINRHVDKMMKISEGKK